MVSITAEQSGFLLRFPFLRVNSLKPCQGITVSWEILVLERPPWPDCSLPFYTTLSCAVRMSSKNAALRRWKTMASMNSKNWRRVPWMEFFSSTRRTIWIPCGISLRAHPSSMSWWPWQRMKGQGWPAFSQDMRTDSTDGLNLVDGLDIIDVLWIYILG